MEKENFWNKVVFKRYYLNARHQGFVHVMVILIDARLCFGS